MKYLVVVAFVAILASLGAALVFMMRRPNPDQADGLASKRMARALTMRIGLSVLLFVLVLVAHQLGWIQPTGLPTR